MIITLFRTSASGAIHYYTIHDRQPLLTSRYSLTLAWRAGDAKEREKVYGFDTLAEKDARIRAAFARKTRDGYKLLYSFIRGGASTGDAPGSAVPGRTVSDDSAAPELQSEAGAS